MWAGRPSVCAWGRGGRPEVFSWVLIRLRTANAR